MEPINFRGACDCDLIKFISIFTGLHVYSLCILNHPNQKKLCQLHWWGQTEEIVVHHNGGLMISVYYPHVVTAFNELLYTVLL